jgi:hypothetical protein
LDRVAADLAEQAEHVVDCSSGSPAASRGRFAFGQKIEQPV